MNKQQQNPLYNRRVLLIGGVAVGTTVLWYLLTHSYPSHLQINEVSFTNNGGQDWVELYNPSLNTISLKGYYLTDSEKNMTRFAITDDIVLPSHGYAVFYGEDATSTITTGTELSFAIKNGETIYLIAPDGLTVIDRLTVLMNEDDTTSVSVGRFPDGNTETFTFSVSTPAAANNKDELDEMTVPETF